MATPMTAQQEIQAKILQLSTALEQDNPGIKIYLSQIHKALKEQEGIVQLLSEEEIAVIVSGYSKVGQVALVESTKSAGKKSGANAALKKITVDDI